MKTPIGVVSVLGVLILCGCGSNGSRSPGPGSSGGAGGDLGAGGLGDHGQSDAGPGGGGAGGATTGAGGAITGSADAGIEGGTIARDAGGGGGAGGAVLGTGGAAGVDSGAGEGGAGSPDDAGVSDSGGPRRPSEYAGFFEGTTSQNLPVSFHVTATGLVPDLLLRLRLNLGLQTCTGTFVGDGASLIGPSFSTIARLSGVSFTPNVAATFASTDVASGTYSGQSGGFLVICGGSLTLGSGSLISAGTFTATRVSTCGNGLVERGEECDPPSATCDQDCQRVPVCGDRFIDFPEACDDGNVIDGDGCSASCQKEARAIAYPSGLPAAGQTVPAADLVPYRVDGVTPGIAYTVSTRTNTDVDLYVYDDPALSRQLCRSIALLSGNETCNAVPTGATLWLVVRNTATTTATLTLNVAEAPPPDGGATPADAGAGG